LFRHSEISYLIQLAGGSIITSRLSPPTNCLSSIWAYLVKPYLRKSGK